MRSTLSFLLLLVTVLHACRPTPPAKEPEALARTEAERDAQGRWPANAATTSGVHGMLDLVEGYPNNGLSDGLLKDSLEEHMADIFVNCTMDGEAHEDLHDFLLPLLNMYRDLPAEPDSVQLSAIRTQLIRYDSLFY